VAWLLKKPFAVNDLEMKRTGGTSCVEEAMLISDGSPEVMALLDVTMHSMGKILSCSPHAADE